MITDVNEITPKLRNFAGIEKKKIVLIFPTPIATIPTGFTFVAKRFRQNNFETVIFVNSFEFFKTMDEYFNLILAEKPDAVGLSYGTINLLEVYRLQKMIQKAGITVIAGGNHPSICPEEALRYGSDIVVRGEGELAIDDIAEWIRNGKKREKLTSIRSGSFLDQDGKVVHNPKSPRIRNLDSLGDLDITNFDLSPYRTIDGGTKGLNIIVGGRGCPFQCTFCSHSEWIQYGYRSADSMIQEMVLRREKYGIRLFWISDETFLVIKGRAEEFCNRIIKEKLDLKWMAGTRVNGVNEEMLKLFKAAGCEQITYGIESLDNYTLNKIRKGYTAAEAYAGLELTGKIGIPCYVNLMTGFPWQTVDSVYKDIAFIRKMGKYVSCFQLYGAVIPYPDTPIYAEYHEKEGFTNFWIRPEYQDAGMCVYQNVPNPYAVSTYWQRNMYDDTYVTDEFFFRYTPEYKRAVAKLGALIGWFAIKASTRSSLEKYFKLGMGLGSRALYEVSHDLEKAIGARLPIKNQLHTKRLTAKFVKT